MARRLSRVRSYVGSSTTTVSPGLTRCANRNASACREPLVMSTWSTATPCLSAIHWRSGGYPTDVPYAVIPAGSASKARAAAALSPATSTMSRDGAPRAKEMSCWAVMTPQRKGRRCSGDGRRALLGPDAHDVAYRDDAEHVTVAVGEHDQVPEAAPDHRGGRLVEGPVGVGVHDVPGQVPRRPFGVGVQATADRVQDVPLGEDAQPFGVRVEDHRRADPALGHLCRHLPEGVLRPDDKDGLAHRILNPHPAHLSCVGPFAFPGRYGHLPVRGVTSQDLRFRRSSAALVPPRNREPRRRG